jgi:CRP-like cAMP-binding protein
VPFQRAGLHTLASLAHRSDEVLWPANTIVAKPGAPSTHAHVVVEGTLDVLCDGAIVQTLGPGTPVGFLETLAGEPHAFAVVTRTPARALRCTGAAILDILEDHTDVGLGMIASFSAALLDAVAN